MQPKVSPPSFFVAMGKGLAILIGVVAGCLATFQALYGLGWLLYSVQPKLEAHSRYFMGSEVHFAADRDTPTTAWIFAPDSYPGLALLGFEILFIVAFAVSVVIGLAMLGGWSIQKNQVTDNQ